MATLGNSTTPTYGYNSYQSTANQVAEAYTMPSPGGIISSVSFYGSGDGATANTAYGCVWSSGGTLLAHGSGVSTSGGSASAGGQAWHTDTLTTPLFVAGGTTIYIGWERSTGSYFDWSFASSGASVCYTAASTPASFGSTASGPGLGTIGAYATYTPAGIQVNTGTPASPVWTTGLAYINTGTAASPVWTQASVYVNTGTPASPVWTQVG